MDGTKSIKGDINAAIGDSRLQELAAQTLQKTLTGIKGQNTKIQNYYNQQDEATKARLEEVVSAFKGSYIQGIIEAEKKRWNHANDNLPSFDYLWPQDNRVVQGMMRALFAVSLPVTAGFNETPASGLYVVIAGATSAAGAAGISYALVALGAISAPVSVPILAIAGVGFAFGLLVVGTAAAVKDFNQSVGRGQITGASWQDAIDNSFGVYFTHDYFPAVLKEIQVNEKAQQKVKEAVQDEAGVNSTSIAFNPLDKSNVRVIENFMIGAVLLGKIIPRHKGNQRKAEDVIKYGIGMYKSSIGHLNGINQALKRTDTFPFPPKTAIQDNRLSKEQQDTIRYVYEVYDHAQSN